MKRPFLFHLFFIVSILSANSQSSLNDLNVVFKHDFESNTIGQYNYSEWQADWLYPAWNCRQTTTEIVSEGSDLINPTKAVQFNFPVDSRGPDEGGAQWYTTVQKSDEVYVSYDLMFMPGFQFQLGGKLPSVQGGLVNSGEKPTGYDGFSGGLMFKEDGLINFYIYYPDAQNPKYGDSFLWGSDGYTSNYFSPSSVKIEYGSGKIPYCRPGEWHNITYRMVLNTVKPEGRGNYDGILEAFFDGKLVSQISHLLFRHTADLGIDCMRMYAFFGGANDDWRNPINEWLKFDNVILYTFKDNINVPRGNTLSPTDRTINYWRKFLEPNTEPPSAPGSLAFSDLTKSSLKLKWNDNSSNEYGFKIYRSLSQTDGFSELITTTANVTSFVDNTLQPATTYYYKVRSFNDIDFSSYTATISATTPFLHIPAAPSGLEIPDIHYTSASLKWNDNSDNETGFEIERSGPDNDNLKRTYSIGAGSASFTDTELLMNSTYSYRIRSYNNDGYSAYSPSIRFTTPVIVPPSAPSALKSKDYTEKSITIEWSDNSNNEDGFVISRSLASNISQSVTIDIPANDTLFIDNNLLSSTSYIYTVKAINLAGNSGTSNKNVAATLSVAETKRIKEGLIAYYNFGFDPDYVVHDQSVFGEPLNLIVARPDAVAWEKNSKLDINTGTVITSAVPACKIIQALKKTNEITIECWVKPFEPDFPSTSRIVSLSNNDDEIGIVLDQEYSGSPEDHLIRYNVRMQTGSTGTSGYPAFVPELGNIRFVNLEHLAYVRDSLGKEILYINGVKSSEGFRPRDLQNWNDNFYLRFGNESDLQHPWKGTFYSIAIYNSALAASQVIHNYELGPCDSIKDKEMDYDINVYPNPASDIAWVDIVPKESLDYVPQTSISVLDMFGRVYYNTVVFNPGFRHIEKIDFRRFQKGSYLVQVISGNNQKSIKLIIH